MYTDFNHFFTVRTRNLWRIKEMLWLPPHLYSVTALPSKTYTAANVNNRIYQTVHVCKTEFWVIQQNRKYFGFHFRLGDPTDYNFRPGKLPEEYYIRDWYRDQSPPTDRPKSTPDFWSIADSTYPTQLPTRQEVAPTSYTLPGTSSLTSSNSRYPLVQPDLRPSHG